MKTYRKAFLTLLVFVAVLSAVGAIWHLMRKQGIYEPNPVRPDDFPTFLILPESAEDVDYQIRREDGIYGVSFIINDPHPSEKTRDFVYKQLKSNGWQRLNHHLMNPEIPIHLAPFEFNWSFPQIEDWLNKDDDHISIHYAYEKLSKEEFDFSKVQVIMTFFDRNSWVRPQVLRYKKFHPEEFDRSTVKNQL